MIDQAGGVLLQYGIAGVAIIGLSAALVWTTRKRDEDRTTYNENIQKVQDARIQDLKDVTTNLKEPMAETAKLTEKIHDILRFGGGREN